VKCSVCKSHIDPKLDTRTLLTVIAVTLLIAFVGGIFFCDWKLTPKYEQKIEKDGEIKKELQKGYLPPKADSKSKQGVTK